MTPIVIDNSIVLAWCLAGESDPIADHAMEIAVDHGAVVPGIWWYELRNALVVDERRGRLDAADTQAMLADLREMPIAIDSDHDEGAVLNLARAHALSVYDAAYLEVAQRRALPLATLDRRLCEAAAKARLVVLKGDRRGARATHAGKARTTRRRPRLRRGRDGQ